MCKNLYIKTWGCQINKYDSDKIISYLFNSSKKYFLVNSWFKADIIILNTCSVRKKAEYKLYSYLNQIKEFKKKKSDLLIIVCGCVASKEKDKLFLKYKIIDIICGTQNIKNIPFLIKSFYKNKKKIVNVDFFKNINKNIFYINKNNNYLSNTFVTIMEGCNKFCSYCVVPFTRGRQISRTPEDIISEINYLVSNGICEVNLLGQNVNSYFSYLSNGKKCNFSYLLNLISEIDGIKRIKFTSSHPLDFKDDVILCYKNISKIVNYLHLPVQSGSNRILNIMGRNYNIKYYKNIIYKLLSIRPNMLFGSDFIVGFPSENNEDFKLTLDLIKEIKFDNSYAFIYSPREGTKSYKMKDDISIFIKKKRLYKIQSLLIKNSIYWSKNMLKSIQEVLVEGYTKRNNYYYGRCLNNKIVYFRSNRCNLIGKIIDIKILKNVNSSLYGFIL